MRIAALLLALCIIVVSLVGIVATDSAMTLRRLSLCKNIHAARA